jgi:hypothetical protein
VLSQAREFDGDMLKVINYDEYTHDAPKIEGMDEPIFKKTNTITPHELTEEDTYAIDRAIFAPPREEPVKQVAPRSQP